MECLGGGGRNGARLSEVSAEGSWDLGVGSSLSTIPASTVGVVQSGPRDKGTTTWGTRKEDEAGGDWPDPSQEEGGIKGRKVGRGERSWKQEKGAKESGELRPGCIVGNGEEPGRSLASQG